MKKALYIFCIVLVSCDVTINKKNNINDIENAKKISSDFYKLVRGKNFTAASKYFGNTVGYEDGLEILKNVNNYFGNLDTVIYISEYSNTTLNSKKNNAEFVFNIKAVYEKMTANEEMVIELINDSLKIMGYHPRLTIAPK